VFYIGNNWIFISTFIVLVGVDGNLHFPVPTMNRLNQTEPATFSILPWWTFFRNSVFIYLMITSVLFVPCGGCKKFPRTFNQWCYIFDPWRSFSTTSVLCCGILSFNFLAFSSWVVPKFLLELCWITLGICCLLLKFVFWRLIYDKQAL
jgi:hypothetical protein